MEISERELYQRSEIACDIGYIEGRNAGFTRGFIGGILFLTCLYSMYHCFNNDKRPENPPAQLIEVEQPNTPLHIQPLFKSNLSDKFEVV